MNTNKVILRTAIVTALGFTLPNYATAAYLEIGSPIKLAIEIPVVDGDVVTYGNGTGFQIDMSAMAGRAISDTSPLEVRLTLTNGAKFAGAATMANIGCDYSAAGAGGTTIAAATNPVAVSVLNGAAGDSTITYKLKDGNIAGTSPKCTVSGLNIGMYGGQKPYTMIATAYLKSNAEPVVINTSGPIIDFTQAYGINVDTKTVTIDVTSPSLSQKFAGEATVVQLGLVGYTAMNAAVIKRDGSSLAKGYILSSLKVTVSGAPLNVTNGLVLALTATDPLGCTAAAGPVAKTATVASGVTFDFGSTTAGIGVMFCLKTDGANRIDKGKVNIDLTAVGANGSSPNVTISNSLLTTVNKNGASIKVLNIPNPTSIDKTFVRIYNLSGAKTSVYGTLYEQGGGTTAGKELGKGKLLGEIDAGAVKVLDAPAIATIFGVSTWIGKAWLQVEGDSQQVRVQLLIRSGGATGPLIDMSDRILEDGRALCRSDTTCN